MHSENVSWSSSGSARPQAAAVACCAVAALAAGVGVVVVLRARSRRANADAHIYNTSPSKNKSGKAKAPDSAKDKVGAQQGAGADNDAIVPPARRVSLRVPVPVPGCLVALGATERAMLVGDMEQRGASKVGVLVQTSRSVPISVARVALRALQARHPPLRSTVCITNAGTTCFRDPGLSSAAPDAMAQVVPCAILGFSPGRHHGDPMRLLQEAFTTCGEKLAVEPGAALGRLILVDGAPGFVLTLPHAVCDGKSILNLTHEFMQLVGYLLEHTVPTDPRSLAEIRQLVRLALRVPEGSELLPWPPTSEQSARALLWQTPLGSAATLCRTIVGLLVGTLALRKFDVQHVAPALPFPIPFERRAKDCVSNYAFASWSSADVARMQATCRREGTTVTAALLAAIYAGLAEHFAETRAPGGSSKPAALHLGGAVDMRQHYPNVADPLQPRSAGLSPHVGHFGLPAVTLDSVRALDVWEHAVRIRQEMTTSLRSWVHYLFAGFLGAVYEPRDLTSMDGAPTSTLSNWGVAPFPADGSYGPSFKVTRCRPIVSSFMFLQGLFVSLTACGELHLLLLSGGVAEAELRDALAHVERAGGRMFGPL